MTKTQIIIFSVYAAENLSVMKISDRRKFTFVQTIIGMLFIKFRSFIRHAYAYLRMKK